MISKWVAKKTMGVVLIEQPKNSTEEWLLKTLEEISEKAGIKVPEFGIFNDKQLNALNEASKITLWL